MKKIINTLSKAVQVVLAAPVKLPAKVVQVVKYVAVALGILESVIGKEEQRQPHAGEEDGGETGDCRRDGCRWRYPLLDVCEYRGGRCRQEGGFSRARSHCQLRRQQAAAR